MKITNKNDFQAQEKYGGWLLQKSCLFNTLELSLIFFMFDVLGCHRIILKKGK